MACCATCPDPCALAAPWRVQMNALGQTEQSSNAMIASTAGAIFASALTGAITGAGAGAVAAGKGRRVRGAGVGAGVGAAMLAATTVIMLALR